MTAFQIIGAAAVFHPEDDAARDIANNPLPFGDDTQRDGGGTEPHLRLVRDI